MNCSKPRYAIVCIELNDDAVVGENMQVVEVSTPEEKFDAVIDKDLFYALYAEMERMFDRADVNSFADDLADGNAELPSYVHVDLETIREKAREIAQFYRDEIDDIDWQQKMINAIAEWYYHCKPAN